LNRDNLYAQGKIDSKDILRILGKYDRSRGGLVAILEEIQCKYGYLPETALRTVSGEPAVPWLIYMVSQHFTGFSA